jgi:hypothetical protein
VRIFITFLSHSLNFAFVDMTTIIKYILYYSNYINQPMSLLANIKNLSYQSKTNDFHKEFYTKFIYLPKLNNVQYILKYYNQNTYAYNDVNKYTKYSVP